MTSILSKPQKNKINNQDVLNFLISIGLTPDTVCVNEDEQTVNFIIVQEILTPLQITQINTQYPGLVSSLKVNIQ